jgi:hypothetical protein
MSCNACWEELPPSSGCTPSQDFHKLCDDKAGTVVLVKVGNWIFGGYTDQTWQGKNFFVLQIFLLGSYNLRSFPFVHAMENYHKLMSLLVLF